MAKKRASRELIVNTNTLCRNASHAFTPALPGVTKLLRVSGLPGRYFHFVSVERGRLANLQDSVTGEPLRVKMDRVLVATATVAGPVGCRECGFEYDNTEVAKFYIGWQMMCGDCRVDRIARRSAFLEPKVFDLTAQQVSFLKWAMTGYHLPAAGDEERAFIESLYDDPRDLTTWLVYADWFEDKEPFESARYTAWLLRNAVTLPPDKRQPFHASVLSATPLPETGHVLYVLRTTPFGYSNRVWEHVFAPVCVSVDPIRVDVPILAIPYAVPPAAGEGIPVPYKMLSKVITAVTAAVRKFRKRRERG